MKKKLLILLITPIILIANALSLNAATEGAAKKAWLRLHLYKNWGNEILSSGRFKDEASHKIYENVAQASEKAIADSKTALEDKQKFDSSWDMNPSQKDHYRFDSDITSIKSNQKALLEDIQKLKNTVIEYTKSPTITKEKEKENITWRFQK